MSDTALVPMDKLREMADSMARAGIFGKTPEQIFSLMLIAQAEGIHPAVAVQEYDIIQNRPAINSRSALSRFQAAGGSIHMTLWKQGRHWYLRRNGRVVYGGSLDGAMAMIRAIREVGE